MALRAIFTLNYRRTGQKRDWRLDKGDNAKDEYQPLVKGCSANTFLRSGTFAIGLPAFGWLTALGALRARTTLHAF